VEPDETFSSLSITLVWLITLFSENIAPAAVQLNAANS
jgi:hypothetical protein